MPNPIGRPPKLANVEELQEKIDSYFASCRDAEGRLARPITITGLALYLDTTRETLMDYQHKDDFSDTIKKAKLRVENYYEERLMTTTPTGAIFALKNFGWSDKSVFDMNAVVENKGGADAARIATEVIEQLAARKAASGTLSSDVDQEGSA